MFILTLVLFVLSFILSVVLTPKPKIEDARPAHLGDFQFPTATEGRVVPLVWGTIRIDGPNVVWYGDYHAIAQTDDVSTGLFSSKTVITGYHYYLGVQFAICRGEVDFLSRIWVNTTKLAFSGQLGTSSTIIKKGQLLGGDKFGTGGIRGTFFFYTGSADQDVNAYLDQTPPDFLWDDNFTLDEVTNQLDRFKNTDPQAYYRVSSADGLAPGGTAHDDNSMVVGPGGNTIRHVRSNLGVYTAPGNLDSYNACLLNPSRPRLLDNISLTATFIPKPASEDFGGNVLWFGCRVQDDPNPTEPYGVFVQNTGQSAMAIVYTTPSGSGTAYSASAPTDFPTFEPSVEHTAQIKCVGNTVTFLLDGVTMWTGTVPGLTDIPDSCGGFCMGFSGNIQQNFATPTDLSDVGFYDFAIDDLTRIKVSNVPAYRGTAYGVFQKGYIGTSTNIVPWSFEVRRCPNGLALTDNHHLVNGFDANPMNVLYEILTDPDWGMGQSADDINLDNFSTNGDTLFTEGNGWSFILDNPIAGPDLIAEVERQINGYLFVDRSTGKWNVTLARGGYTVSDLPLVNEANLISISDFTRGSWDETNNNVTVQFANRDNEYAVTYALAQDMANVAVQDGAVITAAQNYPGIKDSTLANQIAWRDLKTLAYPLAKATLIVDRNFYDANPGDLFRWTDSRLNISDLPMRVTSVDLGQLEAGQIQLQCVQDVFAYETGSFSPPQNTQWIDPQGTVAGDIAPGDRNIFEAPLAFCTRTPTRTGEIDRVWVGARDTTDGSARADLWGEENGDSYSLVGSIEQYAYVAELNADITPTDVTLTLKDGPDAVADIFDTLVDSNARDVGRSLANLISIGDELIGFETVVTSGPDIVLTGVHRGLCDTVPQAHSASDAVWFLLGNLTDDSFTPEAVVDIKLLTENPGGVLDISLASPTELTMDNRGRKPYPPTNLTLSGTPFPSGSTSIDSIDTTSAQQFYDDTTPINVMVRTDITTGWEVGIAFHVTADGLLAGLRFYKGSILDAGTHVGNLWNTSTTDLLASVTFSGEPDVGWCTAFFDPPVVLTASTDYKLTYSAPMGNWTQGTSTIQRVTHADLVDDGNVFSGTAGDFPTTGPSYELYVDPIFVPGTFGPDDLGLCVQFTRRDFRTIDEVKAANNELSLPSDFPTANTTQYAIEVINDPDGTPTLLFTTAWASDPIVLLSRSLIIRAADELPSRLRISVNARHTYSDSNVYEANQLLAWNTDVDSGELADLDFMGVVGTSTATPGSYTAAGTGHLRFTIGTPLTSGVVQYQKNSDGVWHTVLNTGDTTALAPLLAGESGTFHTFTSGDVIIVQHTETGHTELQTILIISDVTPAEVAYCVFILG